MPDIEAGPYGYTVVVWPQTSLTTVDVSVYDHGPPERMLTRSVPWPPHQWDIAIAVRQMAHQLHEEVADARPA